MRQGLKNELNSPVRQPSRYVEANDPLRRRDSPLSNLFPEKDGFIQTGPPCVVTRTLLSGFYHRLHLMQTNMTPSVAATPHSTIFLKMALLKVEHQSLASRSRRLG